MRLAGSGFTSMLDQEVTTIATLWKITNIRGEVKTFTDYSSDIVHDGETYSSYAGFTPTEFHNKSDFSVDSLDVVGLLYSVGINEPDVAAGLYDNASVVIKLINYAGDLDADYMIVADGRLGEVSTQKITFTSELRGKTERLQRQMGELYSPSCRALLGDSRCKFPLTNTGGQPVGLLLSLTKPLDGTDFFVPTVYVTEVTSRQIFKASALDQGNGWFTGGEVLFQEGANRDIRMEIKSFFEGAITLALPLPYTIVVGDRFSITVGCDKKFETCKTKFDNVVNFRGEPHIPGNDKMFETATNRTTDE